MLHCLVTPDLAKWDDDTKILSRLYKKDKPRTLKRGVLFLRGACSPLAFVMYGPSACEKFKSVLQLSRYRTDFSSGLPEDYPVCCGRRAKISSICRNARRLKELTIHLLYRVYTPAARSHYPHVVHRQLGHGSSVLFKGFLIFSESLLASREGIVKSQLLVREHKFQLIGPCPTKIFLYTPSLIFFCHIF